MKKLKEFIFLTLLLASLVTFVLTDHHVWAFFTFLVMTTFNIED